MDGITTGMAFLTGLGMPEILLWVLTFAVVFGVLTKLKIFEKRAPAALISIVVGFFVLLAVPAGLITVIATMSTGLLVVAIGFLVLLALIEIGNVKVIRPSERTKEGYKYGEFHPFSGHGTIMAIILIVIAAAIFYLSGGWALLGFGTLPAISAGTWLLVIVGAAVLWMLSESKEQ
jgi:hypothetical protein